MMMFSSILNENYPDVYYYVTVRSNWSAPLRIRAVARVSSPRFCPNLFQTFETAFSRCIRIRLTSSCCLLFLFSLAHSLVSLTLSSRFLIQFCSVFFKYHYPTPDLFLEWLIFFVFIRPDSTLETTRAPGLLAVSCYCLAYFYPPRSPAYLDSAFLVRLSVLGFSYSLFTCLALITFDYPQFHNASELFSVPAGNQCVAN